jgi:hypothetical protein
MPRPTRRSHRAAPPTAKTTRPSTKKTKPDAEVEFPGVTHGKKRAFLAAYARLGAQTTAAKAAGICRKTVNNWSHSDEVFRDAMETAKDMAADALEVEARRRAFKGSDLLLIFLLKGARPHIYRDNATIQHEVGKSWSDVLKALEDKRRAGGDA